VLDEWFEFEVRPRLTGRWTLIRFADDAVLAFEDFLDAKRVRGVLGKRLAWYGLTLHPDKTRFADFRKNGVGRSTSRVSVPITVPRWMAVLAAATTNARFY
jgi:RNA-directed DNA polymerase